MKGELLTRFAETASRVFLKLRWPLLGTIGVGVVGTGVFKVGILLSGSPNSQDLLAATPTAVPTATAIPPSECANGTYTTYLGKEEGQFSCKQTISHPL